MGKILQALGLQLKPKATATAVVLSPPKFDGFFSTDALELRGETPMKEWVVGLESKVFPRRHQDVKIAQPRVAGNGELSFATDAAEWGGGASIKGIYTLDGYGMSDAQAAWYASQGFIGYQMCAVLGQHWFIDKACTMPARDATRNGYEITVNDGSDVPPDVLDFMKKLDVRFKVQMNTREAIRNCRLFGIRIILFEVTSTDPQYYEKPFNPDGITPGSYQGMSQVDPYWITPELDLNASSNPASKHFYEPTYWRINGRRYHRSHLVVLKTNEVPDVLKPSYFYGGIPLAQQLYERCYAAERTANEAPQLALSKRATVVHTDMVAAVANQKPLMERLNLWAYFRDNFGIKVVGKDETVEQFETALADMDALIMTQYQLGCSIAGVPATKMLGVQPKGFNATGEYEEASYHEDLESTQEHDVRPIVERHHVCCMRAYVVPKFGCKPFETTVVFNPMDAETGKEAAERRLAESTAAKNYADTGAVDGYDIRAQLIANKDSGYSGMAEVEGNGPRPRAVVLPGAPATAPNTPPGTTPASAPATVAATAPAAANAPAPAAATAPPSQGQDEALEIIARFMSGGQK